VSHPSLGLPPRDPRPGHPAAAAIRAARERIAARALEDVVATDPTFRLRYDDPALRRLLLDTRTLLDQLADAVAADDAAGFASWVEALVPRYRKRNVTMDDLIRLLGTVRRTVLAAVDPASAGEIEAVLDGAALALKRQRRVAGDGRKRNPIAAFLWKGS
jgi:hypothetical protein